MPNFITVNKRQTKQRRFGNLDRQVVKRNSAIMYVSDFKLLLQRLVGFLLPKSVYIIHR